MTIEKARLLFEEEIRDVSEKHLKNLKKYMIDSYSYLVEQFSKSFFTYCEKVKVMQEKGEKDAIGYLHLSMMRHKIQNKDYQLRFDAYNKDWYKDKVECTSNYSATPIFNYLRAYEEELMKLRLKYPRRIHTCLVKQYVLEEANKYKEVIRELVRSTLLTLTHDERFQSIKREPLFVITVGEYRDQVDLVYKEDTTEKNIEEMIEKLAKTTEEPAYYEIFDELLFEGLNFTQSKWMYCTGIKSELKNIDATASAWLFPQLKATNMYHVDLKYSQIIGADFKNSTLVNIDFTGANLFQIDFSGATLENIDFTRAIQCEQLNFEGATLKNVTLPEEKVVF